MDFEETPIIEISAIQNIDGSGLDDQIVEDVHIVDHTHGNNGYGWNVAPQIQERVEFYRALVFAKFRPGKQGKAQVDGG